MSGSAASLHQGEVKVIQPVCPHQALKKTPACRRLCSPSERTKRCWSQAVDQCARGYSVGKKRDCIIEGGAH